MLEQELVGFDVMAELAIGLAGFSGVLIVLIRPSGRFSPPEHLRLINLIYSSLGVMILSVLPFGFAGLDVDPGTAWGLLGLVASVYLGIGIMYIPFRVWRTRRDYPDIFPMTLFVVQSSLHGAALLLCVAVFLGVGGVPSRLYFLALVLILVHAAIVYLRTLLYRRPIEEVEVAAGDGEGEGKGIVGSDPRV